MSITLRIDQVSEEHLGFTSVKQNDDGTVTIYYGDEDRPVNGEMPQDQPPSWWARVKAWFKG